MKKFIAEFKEFAMKGNVVDMAIGVVIGAAFGKITTSLVNDVIMPLISRITGGVDFSAWKWVLKAAEVDETGAETAAEIDREVLRIVKQAHEKARGILTTHRDILDEASTFLLQRETITGEEFMTIVRRHASIPAAER